MNDGKKSTEQITLSKGIHNRALLADRKDKGEPEKTSGDVGGVLSVVKNSGEDVGIRDPNDSEACPFDYICEFLSALMAKNYREALRLAKVILRYEPKNKTVLNFLPVLEETILEDDLDMQDDCAEKKDGTGPNSDSSSDSEAEAVESEIGSDDSSSTSENSIASTASTQPGSGSDEENNSHSDSTTSSDSENSGETELSDSESELEGEEGNVTSSLTSSMQSLSIFEDGEDGDQESKDDGYES